jgi:hypothetical protein
MLSVHEGDPRPSPRRFIMIRASRVVTLLFVGLVFAPAPGEAQLWTHTAHTCVVDEAHSSGQAVTFGSSLAVHRAGTIVARCNVTNRMDGGQSPDWGALEIVYTDPPSVVSSEKVTAALLRIDNDGDLSLPIATFSSDSFLQSTAAQKQSVAFSHVFEFAEAAYFVEITITEHGTGLGGPPRRRVFLVRLRPVLPR